MRGLMAEDFRGGLLARKVLLGRGGRPRAQSPMLMMCPFVMLGTQASVKAPVN